MSQKTGDLLVFYRQGRHVRGVGTGAGGQHTSISARPGSDWPLSEDLKKLSSVELTACI